MTWQAAVRAWVAAGSGIALGRVIWADQGGPRPSSADGPWISLRELAETSGGRDWLVTEANPLTVDLDVAGVNVGASTLDVPDHGLATGAGPVRLTTTGTAPGGLAIATDYWVIVVDSDTLQLAADFLGAVETPAPITFTDAGTGSHVLASTATTVAAGAELTHAVAGTRVTDVVMQCFGGPSVDANGAAGRLKRTVAALSLPSVAAALRAGHVGVLSTGSITNVGAVHQLASFEARATLTARLSVPVVDATETGTVIATTEPTATIT